MKVFISHSSRDRWVARKISEDLNGLGVKTFLDEKDMDTGVSIDESISANLKDCDECLILLSSSSINSQWVLVEMGGAKALGKRLIPILLNIGVNEIPNPISKNLARDINEIEKYYSEVKNRQAGHSVPRQPAASKRQRATTKRKIQSLKVGDKVRLPSSRPLPVERKSYMIEWTRGMDKYFGKTAIVIEVDKDKTVALDIDNGYYWYAFEWLKKTRRD